MGFSFQWLLLSWDLVVPSHVWSSRTRNWTLVPYLGRWILNHWTTREVPRGLYHFHCGVFNFQRRSLQVGFGGSRHRQSLECRWLLRRSPLGGHFCKGGGRSNIQLSDLSSCNAGSAILTRGQVTCWCHPSGARMAGLLQPTSISFRGDPPWVKRCLCS